MKLLVQPARRRMIRSELVGGGKLCGRLPRKTMLQTPGGQPATIFSAVGVGRGPFEPIGLVPMCGHGSIAIAKVLVENEEVKVTEPVTKVILDTIGGLVDMSVRVEDGEVGEITLRIVDSFSGMHVITSRPLTRLSAAFNRSTATSGHPR